MKRRGIKTAFANVMDRQALTITHLDAIIASILSS